MAALRPNLSQWYAKIRPNRTLSPIASNSITPTATVADAACMRKVYHRAAPAVVDEAPCEYTRSMRTGDEVFEIREAGEGKGSGMFAARSIRAGEFIAEYTGTRIPTAVADAMKSRYLFEIDEDWTIDGEDERNVARYINHACVPNAEADIRGGKILIFAVHGIARGEEITIDYGEEYFDEFITPSGCRCESCLTRSR